MALGFVKCFGVSVEDVHCTGLEQMEQPANAGSCGEWALNLCVPHLEHGKVLSQYTYRFIGRC